MVDSEFLPSPPAGSWRSLAAAFAVFAGLTLAFLFGASALGVHDVRDVEPWIGAGVRGPLALPAVITSFAVLAFLGVPQFVLIAAAALAFGPWTGAVYSWIGTMTSALVGFGLGRRFGERVSSLTAGASTARYLKLVARNGFLASLIVRLVPSAPFVVVNMAAGMTPMRLAAFAAGTGIGIVPKIGLTVFAGEALLNGVTARSPQALGWLAGAAAVCLGSGALGRAWRQNRRP